MGTQLVWKTVPLRDEHNQMKRAENPPAQYGIDVTQVLIGDPKPEDTLDRLLVEKKRLVAERIKSVQEQKELVVIANQRDVEVVKQVAERENIVQRKLQALAVIDKEKELAVAKAELDIQKANSHAARFQAEAIASKGKAEADVLHAMYRAKAQNKEIFLAETQRDIATALYTNLKDFKVVMPANVIVSGGGNGGDGGAGKLPSNLDVITGFSALGMMEKAMQK